jgi:hypothetical protein
VTKNGYGVFDGLRKEEVEHCASEERGCEVRREIVVDE